MSVMIRQQQEQFANQAGQLLAQHTLAILHLLALPRAAMEGLIIVSQMELIQCGIRLCLLLSFTAMMALIMMVIHKETALILSAPLILPLIVATKQHAQM
jgi:hypothetical protein